MKKISVVLFALAGLVLLYSFNVMIDQVQCDAHCQQQYERRMEAYAKQLRDCGSLMVKEDEPR
jgi:hypothetical protein